MSQIIKYNQLSFPQQVQVSCFTSFHPTWHCDTGDREHCRRVLAYSNPEVCKTRKGRWVIDTVNDPHTHSFIKCRLHPTKSKHYNRFITVELPKMKTLKTNFKQIQ